MALLRLSFNEGSLLRRTLLHVGTFVLGSVAFISLVSFVLVSVAKGLLPREQAPADVVAEHQGEEAGKPAKPPGGKTNKKVVLSPPTKDD